MNISSLDFSDYDWSVSKWELQSTKVTVCHNETFKLKWSATKLVTFIFIIERSANNPKDLLTDYEFLRKYAGQHKKTFLPLGFQCGYAILPIYLSTSFTNSIIYEVEHHHKKRWCVLHQPALKNISTGQFHTLTEKNFWGGIYHNFINNALHACSLQIDKELGLTRR